MPDPRAVNSMFSRIAERYDVANRLLSGGIDVWWRKKLVRAVARTGPTDVLDLATGSGDVAFALARNVASARRIIGMDFCQPMLDEAVKKQKALCSADAHRIEFRQGDGLALPLPDESFDAITISFGLRNMGDRRRSLTEMLRVLRPGGMAFILEFSQPHAWFRPFYLVYLREVLPRVAGMITGDRGAYTYLNETIEQFPGREALSVEISDAGFSRVSSFGMTAGVVALHQALR
ncbi:MAG: bifunctional demethylmenaquinone methyltransferase/2-methoxy-6-polyprenyl-1,4-benzoquinol methylase UbiE [Opitutus sp.]